MLQALDVLIGVTLVMLIMSAAVTMLTQFFGTWLLNLKGTALRQVIGRLLETLDGELVTKDARKIANRILRDPLIGQPGLILNSQSLATVVHREELVKLIFKFASAGKLATPPPQTGDTSSPPQATVPQVKLTRRAAELLRLQQLMAQTLQRNGIQNPAQILVAVRSTTLELEKALPELSNSERTAVAILDHAQSDFLAKVNGWFDQTIDRAVDIFTVRIRIVTVCVSLGLALLFQLNSFELINRLSVDGELRKTVVAAAIDRANRAPQAASAANASTQSLQDVVRNSGADQLEEFGPIAFPGSPEEWLARWNSGWGLQLIGIILTAALLSLGAPFWYSLLANLVGLRSVVAGKDDAERSKRQKLPTTPA